MSQRLPVDSSGWLELSSGGPTVGPLAEASERPEQRLVPSINLFNACQWVLRSTGTALRGRPALCAAG